VVSPCRYVFEIRQAPVRYEQDDVARRFVCQRSHSELNGCKPPNSFRLCACRLRLERDRWTAAVTAPNDLDMLGLVAQFDDSVELDRQDSIQDPTLVLCQKSAFDPHAQERATAWRAQRPTAIIGKFKSSQHPRTTACEGAQARAIGGR
jgi:hypothetical protein